MLGCLFEIVETLVLTLIIFFVIQTLACVPFLLSPAYVLGVFAQHVIDTSSSIGDVLSCLFVMPLDIVHITPL